MLRDSSSVLGETSSRVVLASRSINIVSQGQPAFAAVEEANARSTMTEQGPPLLLSEQQMFLLFVKILLMYVRRTKDQTLRRRTVSIITECTQRNRQGDPAYTPLMEAVQQRLRDRLGYHHFASAKRCFDVYCERRGVQQA